MKAVVWANFDDSVSASDASERRSGRFTALARLLAARCRLERTIPSRPSLTPGIEERGAKAHDLSDGLEETVEQRWRSIVSVVE